MPSAKKMKMEKRKMKKIKEKITDNLVLTYTVKPCCSEKSANSQKSVQYPIFFLNICIRWYVTLTVRGGVT